MQYLRIFLQTLRDEQLFAKFSKCKFLFDYVTFIGYIMSNDGIMVDPTKIESIHAHFCD